MSVISIFESEVSCLSSILDLQRRCQTQNVELSTETNKYLLYLTLKKVGPSVAQRVVSKLVEQGEITWNEEEEFEVEQILDYVEEDGEEFYLIKWRGWSHAHNSWEPKQNLDCPNLIAEFDRKNSHSGRAPIKRKFDEIKDIEEEREAKRTRVDELFYKLTACKERMTPLRLISLTSPDKGIGKRFKGVVSCAGLKVPKFNVTTGSLLNPRTKAYKLKKIEIKKALKEWEKHLNNVNTDPAPIAVENGVDLEGPPENFEYINDYKPGPGIEIPNDPIIGCECEDCSSQKSKCCPGQFGVEYAYYKHKRLRITPGRPIYECNKRCKCGPECSNRVVQQGRKHKVCIFRTSNGRGWGVKAMQRIKAGSFVMEYVGEVISSEEAELRGQMYDSVGRTYLFDLDFNGDDCPFTVDAALYGNVSHFVNHSIIQRCDMLYLDYYCISCRELRVGRRFLWGLQTEMGSNFLPRQVYTTMRRILPQCDPNLEVYSVWINTLDVRMPRIALFSRRDVEKGEELTFDYMASKPHTSLDETPVDEDEIAPILEKVEATDENGNEMPCLNNLDQSSEKSRSVLETSDKNMSSVDTDKNGGTKTLMEYATKTQQSPSKLSKVRSPSKVTTPSDVSSPSKVRSPAKMQNLEAFGDNEKLEVIEAENSDPALTGPGGDAGLKMPVLSPRKSPKPPARAYRMVCQCGAKNCRKFVF